MLKQLIYGKWKPG